MTGLLLLACLLLPRTTLVFDPVPSGGAGDNPAGLGYPGGPRWSVQVASFGFEWSSTFLHLDDIARYFRSGVILTEEDKDHLLARAGQRTVRLASLLDGEAAGVQLGRFGVTLGIDAGAALTLPRDAVELTFKGNEFGRQYQLAGLAVDSLLMSRLIGSYAFEVRSGVRVGFGLCWLHGFRYACAQVQDGELYTTRTGISGSADMESRRASAGDGAALTAGVVAPLGDDVTVGACCRDLLANIWWYGNPKDGELAVDLRPVNVRRLYESATMDSFLSVSSRTADGHTFRTSLPALLALGAAWRSSSRLSLAGIANVTVGASPFVTSPLLLGGRLAWTPGESHALSVFLGAGSRLDWTAELSYRLTYQGLLLDLGAVLRGMLAGPRSIGLRLGVGYAPPPEPGEDQLLFDN